MRTFLIPLFILITFTVNAQSTWKLDSGHSSINFSVSHLVISEITGSFDQFDITATTGDDFSLPKFDVSIKTASINTKNSQRDNHLRADDFFDAEKHPAITFKNTSVKKTGDKTFTLKGNLTVKGITKEVSFNGTLNGILKTDRGEKAGLKLTTTIKRTDFKIGGSVSSIGEDVMVVIHLEMGKQ